MTMKITATLISVIFLAQAAIAQWSTIDVGNAGEVTLFKHTGSSTPVPFNIQKLGYSGSVLNYGILHLDMGHNTVGGGSNLYFRLQNSANSFVEYGGVGSYIMDNSAGSEDGALTFYTAYNGQKRTRRMTILNDGNVGIGVIDTEGYRLAVKGSIKAEEIVIETTWSDFVFEDDYNLRSLAEVEGHIKEHGHLPDVPSASVVELEGLSVGESQKFMMQKIEELTLYMIEKDKQVSALQVQVEAQQSRIQELESN